MDKETRSTQITQYTERGWHIIPLRPNAKTPAVASWTPFRERLGDASLLDEWFGETRNNVAVLTGSCSGLLVVDFDDHEQFQMFAQAYPYLLNTYAVKSRRGYHLYFHIPTGITVQSRAGQGVDLLAEGKYVVAPPSIVDDHEYRVMLDLEPKTLKARDIGAIQRFIAQQTPTSRFPAFNFDIHVYTPDDTPKAVETPPEPILAHFYADAELDMTADDLPGIYRAKCDHLGRNDSLFQTATLARDYGLSYGQVCDALIDPFVTSKPPQGHQLETKRQRRQEAKRTIRSAFSHPPRDPHLIQKRLHQLPNNVVEALFAVKQTRLVRTLLGLRLLGVHPGMTFTASQAEDLLSGVVGRRSVWESLEWYAEKVFPEPLSKTATRVAGSTPEGFTNKCILVREKKRGIGSDERVFTMPSNRQLADLLGVKVGRHRDELTLDDLKTAKSTREAFNRAYLTRRPGRYTTAFLAKRLGVCRRTLQNYRAGDDLLHAEPQYHETPIFWFNLNDLPPEEMVEPGCFLVNQWGKRFPVKLGLARKLLAKGDRLILMRQLPNYWWYGRRPDRPEQATKPARTFRQYRVDPVVMTQLPDKLVTQTTGQGGAVAQTARMRLERERFESPEAIQRCAKYVYKTINAMPTEEENAKMSMKTAIRVVEKYGIQQVEKVLWRVKTRRKRVNKPVGLFMTMLRCEGLRN